jgi:hypothetical protein
MLKLLSRNPDVEFTTSLSIEECKRRLVQEFHHEREIFAFHPTVEELIGSYFVVSRNHSSFSRDFVLSGYLKNTSDGTSVQASFKIHGSISAGLILGTAVFFGVIAVGVISDGVDKGLLLFPIVLYGFGRFAFWLPLWVSKSKQNELASYLQNILTPITNYGK